MSKFGIDVSAHNGNINWDKVKSQIDFAILKMGNIGDGNKFWADNSFERNYNECIRLGIPIGVYVYSYTNQIENIDDCARDTLKYLNGRKLQLPIYIDMEDKEIAPEGKNKLTDLVITFNTIIEKSGYWAGVYANRNWFDNYLNKDILKKKYTTWIATYMNGIDKYKGEYDMWQNSSKGRIDGINGNVDTNYMYKDLIHNETNDSNNEKGSDEEVRTYQNGSTRENVYSDTNCTNKIGSLDPWEKCECYGEFDNRAVVRYKVNGTDNYKVGFCKYIPKSLQS